jgi:hypothetical protein
LSEYGNPAKIRQIRLWLARTVKENKDRRDRKIFDMWLACYTQEEIAEAVDITQQAIAKMEDFTTTVFRNQSCKMSANHEVDFTPLYNVSAVTPCYCR